jgi:LuxR family maltose regulon positive regulatory protein
MQYKTAPPVTSPYAIERTRILDCVRQSAGLKVVLVRAPAGYGKTTTLVQLHRHLAASAVDCAWVQMDEADNDVARCLTSLQRALAIAADTAAAPRDTSSRDVDPIEALVEALSKRQLPFALFIDEMDAVSSPAVLALVAGLVGRLPPRAMLVVGTRSEPDIGLARLRANGQLLEIGPCLLQFSTAEATEFVERRGLRLPPEQVAELHRRTEGWVTALWLASMAIGQGTDAARLVAGFNGANTNLADYFAKVVLASQHPEISEFLLETSILDELSAAACDAVRGRNDSARQLARVVNADLFVTPSSEDRSAYRCHSLFAGFLRDHLAATRSDRLPALHRAASDWFFAQGRPVPAISHALRAGPDRHALDLLQQHADGLLRQGRARLLARWLDALPARSLDERPELRVAHAWAVAFTRGAHQALALAERSDAVPDAGHSDAPDSSTLRPLLEFMTDRIEEAQAQALQNLPRLGSRTGFAAAMAAQTLANTHLAKGRFAEARRFADLARHSSGDAPSPFHLALAESVEGAIDLVQGRLKSAIVRLRSASEETCAAEASGAKPFAFPFPGTLLAEALYEAGDIAVAEPMLRGVVPLLLDIALPDQLITAHVLLARIQRQRGELDGALVDLEALETAGHRLRLPRAVACARLERAWGLVDQGDFPEAERQIDRSGSPSFWASLEDRCHVANDVSTAAIARARLLVRKGAAGRAIPELKRQLKCADRAERLRRAMKLRILLAEALHADGEPRLAMREIGLACEFAARDGWAQTFVEEGRRVRALMAQYAESVRPDASAGDRPGIAELLQRTAKPPGEARVPAGRPGPCALTAKEHRVLQLLASGDSNEAIAERLFLSTSTVRTHLRSINAKLNASSRTQAVAIGRRMGLID